MIRRWMDSRFNRRNVLNGDFRDIGVGVGWGVPVEGRDDSKFATYTVVFGWRRPADGRMFDSATPGIVGYLNAASGQPNPGSNGAPDSQDRLPRVAGAGGVGVASSWPGL